MNTFELRKLLSSVSELPPAESATFERARYHALAAFRNARNEMPNKSPAACGFFRWAVVGGLAALLGAALLFSPRESINDATALFDELEAIFPGQLDAVLIDGDDISLVLSERIGERPADQRVRISLPDGPVILSYSGVRLEVAGREITALVSGDGRAFAVEDDGRIHGGHRL